MPKQGGHKNLIKKESLLVTDLLGICKENTNFDIKINVIEKEHLAK